MAWEISITNKGWSKLYDACHNEDKEKLAEGLADFNYETFHGGYGRPGKPHRSGAWNWEKLVHLPHDILADAVFDCIIEVNTCNNGGYKYWIDWDGCQTIRMPE